jgi:hypothetical protein
MRGRFPHKPVIKAILAALAMGLFGAVMASGWGWNGGSSRPVHNAPQAGWAWNITPDSGSQDSAAAAGPVSLTPG